MSSQTFHGKYDRRGIPEEPAGFWAEFRDAVAPQTVALVVGVLILQLAFVWSYVAAFHSPSPHRIAVVVAAPNTAENQTVSTLNALSGEPLQATAVATEAQPASA
jgi:hypothetical protein